MAVAPASEAEHRDINKNGRTAFWVKSNVRAGRPGSFALLKIAATVTAVLLNVA